MTGLASHFWSEHIQCHHRHNACLELQHLAGCACLACCTMPAANRVAPAGCFSCKHLQGSLQPFPNPPKCLA